jgi:two-component system, cell cycle sensor histidine kinase and response regulator CckA
LSLSTENVELDRVQTEPFGLPSGKFVQVSVADTGTGMDENTRQRVFDPFFTTKEMGRGTGLGLASVYGIIKNHGGFITVRSAPKQGTVFRFFLPATSRSASGDGLLVSESMPTGTETILLVDDEAMILDVSEQLLAHLGYTVITADSGTMAIERFEAYRERIALVILDMIMPDMMGGEVFERIRQLSPNTQVILSSGYSEDGQASEILKRGCSGFLQKPYDLLALSQKVRAVLDTPFPSDS